jgi:hypothetical protein
MTRASRDCFANFKEQTQILETKYRSEAMSSDEEAARGYPKQCKRLVEEGKYPPDLVFNVNHTDLDWKKDLQEILSVRQEKYAPGYKTTKGRLTLLLDGNVSGTVKLKPLLL